MHCGTSEHRLENPVKTRSVSMLAHVTQRWRAVAGKLSTLLWLFLAAPALAVDGTALLQQVDRKLEPESYEMVRKLVNIEPDGSRKEFVLYSVKKGKDRIAALFLIRPATATGPRCVLARTCGCTSPALASRCALPACSR